MLYVQQVIIAWEEPTTHVPLHAQRSTQQYHTGQLFAQQVSSVKPVSMFLQQMQRITRTSHSHVQKEPMVDQLDLNYNHSAQFATLADSVRKLEPNLQLDFAMLDSIA